MVWSQRHHITHLANRNKLKGLHQESIGEDDALVRRQGQGALDGLKPLADSVLTSKGMLTKEPLQGAAAGQLGGFERGPLTEKVTK